MYEALLTRSCILPRCVGFLGFFYRLFCLLLVHSHSLPLYERLRCDGCWTWDTGGNDHTSQFPKTIERNANRLVRTSTFQESFQID